MLDRFLARFGGGGTPIIASAPGRVNLIGEHTDYNDGFVMPMTIRQTISVAVRPVGGDQLAVHSADFDERVETRLGVEPSEIKRGWARYVVGVAEELRGQGFAVAGAEILIEGDVPIGAGLSSSAALEVATLLALCKAFDFEIDAVEAAELCRLVEHRWAGVQCGIMDQMASRIGGSGCALLIDCRDRSYERIPMTLGDASVLVVDSGVRRELAESQYNERLKECEAGVAILNQADPSVRTLRDATTELLDRAWTWMPADIAARCRHVVTENARVLAAAQALKRVDLDTFGDLINEAHDSLRDDYEASHPVLDRLVAEARAVDGVLGSRLTGAGWGGCTVNLVRDSAIDGFSKAMKQAFVECEVEGRVIPVADSKAQ